MGRVKIQFPDNNPLYIADIPVRITDINYGNHLGNDSLLSIIHEARVQMLYQHGFTEMNAGGNSLIMADVAIAYKAESFYGDKLRVNIYSDEIQTGSFTLLYNITAMRGEKPLPIAHASTGMVCFDYTTRRIMPMTDTLKNFLNGSK